MARTQTEIGVPLDPPDLQRFDELARVERRSRRNLGAILLLYGLENHEAALGRRQRAVPDEVADRKPN